MWAGKGRWRVGSSLASSAVASVVPSPGPEEGALDGPLVRACGKPTAEALLKGRKMKTSQTSSNRPRLPLTFGGPWGVCSQTPLGRERAPEE